MHGQKVAVRCHRSVQEAAVASWLRAAPPCNHGNGGDEAEESRKMADAVRAYYKTRDLFFDRAAFDTSFTTLLELLSPP